MSIVVNASITGTRLGVEDNGILSAMVFLDYGDSSQGFGGYAFDEPVFVKKAGNASGRGEFKGRRGTAFGMEFIRRFLEVVGVDKWEDLRGQHVRVRKQDGWGGSIEAIGNILKDDWFDPKAVVDQMIPAAPAR